MFILLIHLKHQTQTRECHHVNQIEHFVKANIYVQIKIQWNDLDTSQNDQINSVTSSQH